MNKKKFAPKLYPINRDMRKVWFVKWYDDKGLPKKVYGCLNYLPTIKEREREAKRLIENIFNPPPKPIIGIINSSNLLRLLSKLIEQKKPLLRNKSYQSYESIFYGFARWYRLVKDKEAEENDYFLSLAAKGLHKNTIRNKHIVLKGLCNELVQKRQLLEKPFDGAKYKKVKAHHQ